MSDEQLGRALTAAKAIRNDLIRVSAMTALAQYLDKGQRVEATSEALTTIIGAGIDVSRVPTLRTLTPLLNGLQLDEVLADTKMARTAWLRFSVLQVIVHRLSRKQLVRALALAKAIDDEPERAFALHALAGYLYGQCREMLMDEALAAVKAISDVATRASVLVAIANRMNRAQMDEALLAAKNIGLEPARVSAIVGLARHLNAEQLEEALSAAKVIISDSARASTLSGLATNLDREQLDRALLIAQAIHSDDARAVALRGLGSHLSPDQLDKALAAAVTIKDKRAQASVLIEFASRLNEGQLRKAFAMARAINDCQSASKFDPRSASNFDPLVRRVLAAALAPSKLVGVAETARARVGA